MSKFRLMVYSAANRKFANLDIDGEGNRNDMFDDEATANRVAQDLSKKNQVTVGVFQLIGQWKPVVSSEHVSMEEFST